MTDLRFDAEPTPDAGRELQSLHDARGRIVGWFSWMADSAHFRAMDRMWALLAAVGAALALCAVLAVRGLGAVAFARSQHRDGAQADSQDVDRPAQSPRDDRSLDERWPGAAPASCVFALIDLDGFREVNDTLGRAGGDAVLVE